MARFAKYTLMAALAAPSVRSFSSTSIKTIGRNIFGSALLPGKISLRMSNRNFGTMAGNETVSTSSCIGNQMPHFSSDALINGEIQKLDSNNYFKDSYGLVIFYPLDFTFVCPSELLGFSERISEFESRGIKVIGISIDSPFSHKAWNSMELKAGGIQGVKFPLVSDLSKTITSSFGLLRPEGFSHRASVLIDKQGNVRHISIFDLGIGRSVDETLRVFDAIEYSQQTGHVCPLNWKRGEPSMTPTAESTSTYLFNKYSKKGLN
ncbi:bifunctional Thioredoxin domain/Peroxiredoxin [Babesia duncani]|uniref:Bifunctional Thioredoxin domain/Peroxiredoxin n=1 Tax=Babesia duncani TaxID=323732 RepID=A0AAD9PMK7_9APIC|nr:bifunctional Thioredoxin domain/Peroxiredoxin [Babesia duncani]